jgi:adenylate cyclase
MTVKNLQSLQAVPSKRSLRLVAISVAIIAFFSYLDLFTNALDYDEQKTYGERLEISGLVHHDYTAEAERQIQVVAVDDGSYRWAAGNGLMKRYLPRSYYAQLIDQLTRYGAKVIAFDMLFDSSDSGDVQMASSIKKSGRVLLACGDAGDDQLSIAYPEQIFVLAGCKLGHSRVPLSIDRPAIEEIEPTVESQSGLLPAFSVEAVRMAKGIANLPLFSAASIPRLPLVIDSFAPRPAFRIRFLYAPTEAFGVIPIERIVGCKKQADFVYQRVFRNKLVFIGDTTRILHDRYLTPLETMPGLLIQANAAATVLDGQYIHDAPAWFEVLLLAILVFGTTIPSAIWPLHRVGILILLILFLYFLVNIWFFVEQNLYILFAGPSIAVLLTALVVLLERGIVEESEKARMRSLLLRYVNPKITDHILRHPELIGAGGKREIGTILFADVRGFTKISEELAPEELVIRMNEYFQTITEIVFRHDGTAASIVGDAMLAVFGIPVAVPDHADRAVAAAIEIQVASKALGKRWHGETGSIFKIGIGINTGEVIVGEVGGTQIRNFTVYGLPVNIASRVEDLNKEYETEILLTQCTLDVLKKPIVIGRSMPVQLKGVGSPICVYEVLGYRSSTD